MVETDFQRRLQLRETTNSPFRILSSPNQGTRLDLKQIKQIIDLMKRSELTEFEFEEEGFKIRAKRGAVAVHPSQLVAPPSSVTLPNPEVNMVQGGMQNRPEPSAADEAGIGYVKSPMVGTFYRSPSPENPPFIEKGAKVEDKTVVCIIEAMKIMNEIQAESKGTVLEILVENGQPVEYGQRLFKIKLG